eukprot:755262-Hanusia_phi.AAC.3
MRTSLPLAPGTAQARAASSASLPARDDRRGGQAWSSPRLRARRRPDAPCGTTCARPPAPGS